MLFIPRPCNGLHLCLRQNATEVVENGVQSFTAADNWWALVNQGKLFLFALVYLLIRNDDFKQLKVKLEWTVLLWGPLIFIGAG